MCSSVLPSAVVTSSASLCGPMSASRLRSKDRATEDSTHRAASAAAVSPWAGSRATRAPPSGADRNTSSPSASRSCVHPCGRRLGHKPVSRSACRRSLVGAHRHPQYVWGIGLQAKSPGHRAPAPADRSGPSPTLRTIRSETPQPAPKPVKAAQIADSPIAFEKQALA